MFQYGAALALSSLWLMVLLLWFVIAILVAVWVYKDAESRGESGVMWLIIVILTGIIGLIIWLLVRPSRSVRGPSVRGYGKYIVAAVVILAIVLALTCGWALGWFDFGTVKVPVDGTPKVATVAGYVMQFTFNQNRVTVLTQGNWGQTYVTQGVPADMNLVSGTHYARFTFSKVSGSYAYVKWVKKEGVSPLSTVPYFTRPR